MRFFALESTNEALTLFDNRDVSASLGGANFTDLLIRPHNLRTFTDCSFLLWPLFSLHHVICSLFKSCFSCKYGVFFQKMTKWAEENGIEFWTMPVDRAEEALDVLRNGFFEEEAFCVAVGVDKDKCAQRELEKLALESAKDGISIMAIDKESRKIVGVSYNKYQTAVPSGQRNLFEEFRDTKCRTKRAKALINEMLWFDSVVDLYDKYHTDCSVEIMFLGTHQDFRRRGVAVGCVKASLCQARTMSVLKKPPIATAIFTSPYSIRTGRILHFDEVVHVSYHNRSYEGLRFCDNPKVGKDHPGAVVMVKILNDTP